MKRLFISMLLILPLTLWAQSEKPSVERTQSLSLNIIGLQYNYEMPLSRTISVNFHGGLVSDFAYERWSTWDSGIESDWNLALRASVGADFRYFYNLDRRASLGKNTSRNSGNFLSVDMMYASPAFWSRKDYHSDNVVLAIPAYGLRRVYPSGLLIEARAGYAVGIDGDEWGGKVKLDYKVGFSF